MQQEDILNKRFGDLWESYKKYLYTNVKISSYNSYVYDFEIRILPYFKDYAFKDISVDVFIDWRHKIDNSDFKWSYKSKLHTIISQYLQFCCDFYDLKVNIAKKVGNFKKRKRERREINVWTLEEFEKFISCVDDDVYKALFITLYFTGLRIGECLALNWNDLINDEIDVNKTLLKAREKNGDYIFNTPKTYSSYRRIKLPNNVLNVLNKLLKKQKENKDFKKAWFIFGGAKALSETTITRKKNNYCSISGAKKIKLHEFRHSHATLLLSENIPITVISNRLGHSDIAMTLNTYSHLIAKDEDKAVDYMNNIKSKSYDISY